MPARRREPVSVPRTFHSSAGRPMHHDYGIDESISRAGYFSNAVLDDTEAAAARSRGKDYDLLRNTNSAIVATDVHASPRTAVASMRARASSVPPKVQGRPARLHQQLISRPKVVGGPQVAPTIIYMSDAPSFVTNPARSSSRPVVQSEVPWRMRAGSVSGVDLRSSRAGSLPPRPQSYHQGLYEPRIQTPLGTEGMRATRSPVVLRGGRAGSVPPPRPRSLYAVEDHSPIRRIRASSVQPMRPQSFHSGGDQPRVGTEGLRAHLPPVVSRLDRAQSVSRFARKPFGIDEAEIDRTCMPKTKSHAVNNRSGRGVLSRAASEPPSYLPASDMFAKIPDVEQRTLGRHLYARRGQVGPRFGQYPLVSMPPIGPQPSNRAKAAIIGSKMEAEDGAKKRKPRPLYQLDKTRESSAGSGKSAIFYDSVPMSSAGLSSSRPPLPKLTDRKAIRTVDGFSKPKNVMSWEHRIESRIHPDDLIYQPASFGRLRDQLRSSKEKMDRHRQLLDRYNKDDEPISKSSQNNASSSSSSAGGDPNNAPMSDLRRRLRRTLAKTKN